MNNEKPNAVIIADDHAIVRYAFRTILEGSAATYSIVGEAGDADETLKLVDAHKPDLLLLDLCLPGKSGLEVLYELKRREQRPRIVVISMYDMEEKVRQAFAAGVDGYILKDTPARAVLDALLRVQEGEVVLPGAFEYLRGEIATSGNGSPSAGDRDPLDKLSKREREIFHMLTAGDPNRVIAKRLFISPRTVETHRARIIRKLRCSSTVDLVRFAIKNNLMLVD